MSADWFFYCARKSKSSQRDIALGPELPSDHRKYKEQGQKCNVAELAEVFGSNC